MPINIITGQTYEIDYQKLRIELMEMDIFRDKSLQQMYVDKWVAELMLADTDSVKSYLEPNNQELIKKEKQEAPETFQTLVKWKDSDIYVHFRVSRIKQMLEKAGVTEADAQEIALEEFAAHKRIRWTETEDVAEGETPILMVPFTIGETEKNLVIDGNDRITTALKNKKKSIKAITINPEGLIKNHLLSSSFDLLYYIFQNEVVWMASFYHEKDIPDEQMLITQSFFASGNVNITI